MFYRILFSFYLLFIILSPVHSYSQASVKATHLNGGARVSSQPYEGMQVFPDSVVYEYYDSQTQAFFVSESVAYRWTSQLLPISTNTYYYNNGILSEVVSTQFTHNNNRQLVRFETISTDTSEFKQARTIQTYSAQGDIASYKQLFLKSGVWQTVQRDSTAYEYVGQKPVSIVRYYAEGEDSLNPYRRYFDIQHNRAQEIISYKESRKDIFGGQWEPGYGFYDNIKWQIGYRENMMGIFNGWPSEDFVPNFPRRSYHNVERPTSLTQWFINTPDTTKGFITSNNNWQQGVLTVYVIKPLANGSRDTLQSNAYRRDAFGRVIEDIERIKTHSGINSWHNNNTAIERITYDFDTNGFNTLMKTYRSFQPSTGQWSLAYIKSRYPILGTSSSPQVWQMNDSIETNGNRRPTSRETYYFGQVAASVSGMGFLKSLAYPNPTRDFFQLTNINAFGEQSTLRLFNAFGQLVLHNELQSANGDSQKIQLPLLPAGIYFMVLESEKGTSSQRLVIE